MSTAIQLLCTCVCGWVFLAMGGLCAPLRLHMSARAKKLMELMSIPLTHPPTPTRVSPYPSRLFLHGDVDFNMLEVTSDLDLTILHMNGARVQGGLEGFPRLTALVRVCFCGCFFPSSLISLSPDLCSTTAPPPTSPSPSPSPQHTDPLYHRRRAHAHTYTLPPIRTHTDTRAHTHLHTRTHTHAQHPPPPIPHILTDARTPTRSRGTTSEHTHTRLALCANLSCGRHPHNSPHTQTRTCRFPPQLSMDNINVSEGLEHILGCPKIHYVSICANPITGVEKLRPLVRCFLQLVLVSCMCVFLCMCVCVCVEAWARAHAPTRVNRFKLHTQNTHTRTRTDATRARTQTHPHIHGHATHTLTCR